MDNKGQVIIHIEGKHGAVPLTPENYDITLMQSVLGYAIILLDLDKRKERPVTTLKIEEGSIKNIFTTSKQKALAFSSVLALVLSTSSIDQLEPKTAIAFENIQNFAIQHDLNIDISTSESSPFAILSISIVVSCADDKRIFAFSHLYFNLLFAFSFPEISISVFSLNFFNTKFHYFIIKIYSS
jgi:hypothetical protein